AFWLKTLGVAVRSLEGRAAAAATWLRQRHQQQQHRQYKTDWRLQQEAKEAASMQQQTDTGELTNTDSLREAVPPPFPLPGSLTNINHRFYNVFKLMNAAGWDACLELPTPHSRLESWRLGSELRHLYFTRFDSRVSVHRELLPQHLEEYVLPHADAVLVLRDGIVDPSLSRGVGVLASQLADQEEVGGVAASQLEGMERKNPHEKQQQHSAHKESSCGCPETATAAEAAEAAAAAAAAAAGEPEDGENGEGEPLPAVCCSFFDLQDAPVRAEIEQQLRFIPEYTNYWRKNTQPFHRGQVGKTSRKYDNDFAIYDYRKLDFGMAKMSALNLAGMHDAAALIVTDWEEEPANAAAAAGDDSSADEQEEASQRAATAAALGGAAGAGEGEGDAATVKETGNTDGRSKRKPVVLQVIHVTTSDEIDRIGEGGSSSSSSSSDNARIATPLINPRFVIHVGRNAKCQIHQTQVSLSSLLSPTEQQELKQLKQHKREQQQQQKLTQKGFRGPCVNSATRVVLEEGAELHHVYSQELDEDSAHFENLSVCCQPRSKYKLTFVDLGAALSRFALQVEGSEGSSHVSRGISLLNKDQDHSKFEMLHHIAPDAETDQVHKSLVAGKARAIWRGRIRIERQGTGASASSLNRVILLEDGARCVAVPTLEIVPEDIKKATHGAAIRDFDTEPLFYMMSRGLPIDKAKRLLMLAFVDDVVSPVNDEKLAARVRRKVEGLLPKSSSGQIHRHHMFRGGDGGG
ncbi:sufB/sufD domain-containing protein, putative, partial [Eimeria necatrix]